MKFCNQVYELCKSIPKGKVSTYKILAEELNTKAYRAVGQALKKNPNPDRIPCFKIVKSNGSIGGFSGKTSGPKIKEKIKLLKKEGIQIKNNKIVDFEKVVYRFEDINNYIVKKIKTLL